MARNYSKVLLLTANVGSIFEDVSKKVLCWSERLEHWFSGCLEFFCYVQI